MRRRIAKNNAGMLQRVEANGAISRRFDSEKDLRLALGFCYKSPFVGENGGRSPLSSEKL